jgi:Small integral membrane protein
MFDKILTYILTEHRGKTIGVTLGLITSILFLSFGFWRTIFVVFCIFAGYQIGKQLDNNTNLDFWLNSLFKPKK